MRLHQAGQRRRYMVCRRPVVKRGFGIQVPKDRAFSKVLAAIFIAIVVASGSFGYFVFRGQPHTTSCGKCFISQPVVDLVISELASSTGKSGHVNEQLNVTAGQVTILHIQVYSETQVNVTLTFHVFDSSANLSSGITGAFSPQIFVVPSQGNQTSVLQMNIPNNAEAGLYPAVASATDLQNSSWVWGTYFGINVTR